MQLVHPKYDRITMNPEVCFGKPCIRGMRMPVASVLDYLAGGKNVEELLLEFNFLEREDIFQAQQFQADA